MVWTNFVQATQHKSSYLQAHNAGLTEHVVLEACCPSDDTPQWLDLQRRNWVLRHKVLQRIPPQ